ncbi:hypothetical protein ACS0TY_033827 [Phlomoides rotata]
MASFQPILGCPYSCQPQSEVLSLTRLLTFSLHTHRRPPVASRLASSTHTHRQQLHALWFEFDDGFSAIRVLQLETRLITDSFRLRRILFQSIFSLALSSWAALSLYLFFFLDVVSPLSNFSLGSRRVFFPPSLILDRSFPNSRFKPADETSVNSLYGPNQADKIGEEAITDKMSLIWRPISSFVI